jgi:CHASE2 domain-containing sensor protein
MENIKYEDIKRMVKWIRILMGWSIICFISIIWFNWITILGVWLTLIGVVMSMKQKSYKLWYERVYGKY